MIFSKGVPSEREWAGWGSQTWVIPEVASSGTEFLKKLYHPPSFFQDSQLNPCPPKAQQIHIFYDYYSRLATKEEEEEGQLYIILL